MIKLNGKIVKFDHFLDHSCQLIFNYPLFSEKNEVTFLYDNDEEILQLYYLISHIKNFGHQIHLIMPYINSARQDRVKTSQDVFTLKYFCNLINSLNIDFITVFDPHSPVSTALLNHVRVEMPDIVLKEVYSKLPENTNCAYPDGGSYKRYCNILKIPAVFGVKERDWETREIHKLRLAGDIDDIAGHSFLLIDDIASRGSTLYLTAKQLKEFGATNIYIYVSHCENTILQPHINGQSLLDIPGLITKLYTTNSIWRSNHSKVEIIKSF